MSATTEAAQPVGTLPTAVAEGAAEGLARRGRVSGAGLGAARVRGRVADQGPGRRGASRLRVLGGSMARRVAAGGEQGMATAEYAIATIAAVGFAGLLIVVLRSTEVRELLLGIIRGALST